MDGEPIIDQPFIEGRVHYQAFPQLGLHPRLKLKGQSHLHKNRLARNCSLHIIDTNEKNTEQALKYPSADKVTLYMPGFKAIN